MKDSLFLVVLLFTAACSDNTTTCEYTNRAGAKCNNGAYTNLIGDDACDNAGGVAFWACQNETGCVYGYPKDGDPSEVIMCASFEEFMNLELPDRYAKKEWVKADCETCLRSGTRGG